MEVEASGWSLNSALADVDAILETLPDSATQPVKVGWGAERGGSEGSSLATHTRPLSMPSYSPLACGKEENRILAGPACLGGCSR